MKLSRRRLLAGLGATAASIPLLSTLQSAHAETSPKRFVVFVTPNEPIGPQFWEPTGSFQLTDVMQPLEAWKERLLMIGHVEMVTRQKDNFGAGHVGYGHMLTGEINRPYGSHAQAFWAGGPSVDQVIANHLGVEALTVAARPGATNGNGRISYAAARQPVHPFADPLRAFDSVLASYSLPEDELKKLRAQKRSVLDAVHARTSSLRKRVSTADREKLDLHMQRIEQIESSLTNGGTFSCDPNRPDGGFDYASNGDYPVTARRHMDVVAQALACGVTQVASIQLGSSGSDHATPRWPQFGIDTQIDEHNVAHNYNSSPNPTNVALREALERFYYSQFAYLLEQLDSYPEGTGTLLDNTLVLWAKPLGRNHSGRDMLFMLAGGAGGALQTGRYIDRQDEPHNNLLTSCCHLMGKTDINKFGDPDICTGAMNL